MLTHSLGRSDKGLFRSKIDQHTLQWLAVVSTFHFRRRRKRAYLPPPAPDPENLLLNFY
jgi:hypothetical protein